MLFLSVRHDIASRIILGTIALIFTQVNPGIAKTFVSHLRENKQRASYTILFDNIPNRRRMAHNMIQSSV